MIDYYFVFNLSYTGSHSRIGIITFFFHCITFAGISSFFITYSLLLNYKNKILWVNLITLLFAYISAAISGRSYPHYGIILIPFFLIPTVLSVAPLMEKTKEISVKIAQKRIIIPVVLLCALCIAIYPPYRSFYVKLQEPIVHNEIYDYLSSETTEKDDVLILGNSVYTYLNSNRFTENKFFYQDPPIDVSDKLYQEFIFELENSPSDYIINQSVSDTPYSEEESDTVANHQKVIDYLNSECEKGIYQLETFDSFQVYVRK